jgi:hypothetical protein
MRAVVQPNRCNAQTPVFAHRFRRVPIPKNRTQGDIQKRWKMKYFLNTILLIRLFNMHLLIY